MGVTSEFTASSVLPLGLPGYLGSIPQAQETGCSLLRGEQSHLASGAWRPRAGGHCPIWSLGDEKWRLHLEGVLQELLPSTCGAKVSCSQAVDGPSPECHMTWLIGAYWEDAGSSPSGDGRCQEPVTELQQSAWDLPAHHLLTGRVLV